MNDMAHLHPDASPGELNKPGVRRVNNLPIILLFVVIVLFVVVMISVAHQRSESQNEVLSISEVKTVGDSSPLAKDVIGAYKTGFIISEAQASQHDSSFDETSMYNRSDVPPNIEQPTPNQNSPNMAGGLAPSSNTSLPNLLTKSFNPNELNDNEKERIQIERMRMLEQAVKANTAVQAFDVPNSNWSGNGGFNPAAQMERNRMAMNQSGQYNNSNAAIQDRINQLKEMVGGVVASNPSAPGIYNSLDSMSNNSGNGYSQFDGQSNRWNNNSKVRPPNPFQITAGFVIPGIMVSGINSDLPGQIMAQVGENVYDTATGNNLLIPQGSKLVGSYSNEVSYGQSRVLVAWQRIIFPDGKTLDIGSMPGADAAGFSGYKDRVNNHFWRVFGSAFLMSGIVAGVNLSQDHDDSGSLSDRKRASDAMSEALGQQLGQAMSQMIMKNLNIAPTLEIRPGYRFNVIATKDLSFGGSYVAFDY